MFRSNKRASTASAAFDICRCCVALQDKALLKYGSINFNCQCCGHMKISFSNIVWQSFFGLVPKTSMLGA